VIDSQAQTALSGALAEWVVQKLDRASDYGRDYLVIVTSATGEVGADDFVAQLKGAAGIRPVASGAYISCPLKVTTVNLLLEGPPAMLAVCDVNASGQPIYWCGSRMLCRR